MTNIDLLTMPKPELNDLVAEALKAYRDGNLQVLVESPLAEESLVAPCFFTGEPMNPSARGMALQSVLRWGIDKLQPNEEHSWIASRWRSYNILHYFYLQEMRIADLAYKMSIAEPTWYQARLQAVGALTSILREELATLQSATERKHYAIADRYARCNKLQQQILRMVAIFKQPIFVDLLYQLAGDIPLDKLQTHLQQLLQTHLLVTNNYGTEFLAAPEIRPYLLTLLTPKERQQWHQAAAMYYQNQRDFLEVAQHLRAATNYPQAAQTLIDHHRQIIDNLDIEALRELLTTFRPAELKDKNLWAQLKIIEGQVADYLEDVDTALNHYQEALSAPDIQTKISAYHHRARTFERKNIDEALAHYHYCVQLLETYQPTNLLLIRVLIDMAWIFIQEKEDYVKGETLLTQAQTQANPQERAVWSDLQNALAQLRYRQGKLPTAIEHQLQAWLAANEMQDVQRMVNTVHNLGQFYVNAEQYEQGINYLERGQVLADQAGNRQAKAACHKGIGAAWFWLEDYAQAIDHYLQAYAIFEEMGNVLWLASACYDIAEGYAKVNDVTHSKTYFNQGTDLATTLQHTQLLDDFAELAQTYAGLTPPAVDLLDRQKEALEFVKETGKITNRGYRDLTGISQKQAVRDLKDLVEKGVLIEDGAGRGRCYILPVG